MKITFMLASTCLILGLVQSITAHANAINESKTVSPDSRGTRGERKTPPAEAGNEQALSDREVGAKAKKQPISRLTESSVGERRQSFFLLLQILRSAK